MGTYVNITSNGMPNLCVHTSAMLLKFTCMSSLGVQTVAVHSIIWAKQKSQHVRQQQQQQKRGLVYALIRIGVVWWLALPCCQ